jgi:hypothetical protein
LPSIDGNDCVADGGHESPQPTHVAVVNYQCALTKFTENKAFNQNPARRWHEHRGQGAATSSPNERTPVANTHDKNMHASTHSPFLPLGAGYPHSLCYDRFLLARFAYPPSVVAIITVAAAGSAAAGSERSRAATSEWHAALASCGGRLHQPALSRTAQRRCDRAAWPPTPKGSSPKVRRLYRRPGPSPLWPRQALA